MDSYYLMHRGRNIYLGYDATWADLLLLLIKLQVWDP